MNRAVIFAVGGASKAFAMRDEAGEVILATADDSWVPAVGERLSGYAHKLGPCEATVECRSDSICIDIRSGSDLDELTIWGLL